VSATAALVSADGTPLVVEDSGSGVPLVLVHGGMTSTRVFDRALGALTQRYRCLVLGRRGYGQSGDSPGHSYDLEAQDVIAVLATLDEPAHLFGHSSGAVAAATAALTVPDRLRSLLLYEPPFPVDGPYTGPWIAAAEQAVAAGDNEDAVLIGFREGIGYSEEQISRIRHDPGWVSRTALAPAWVREMRSIEALPVGVERFTALSTPTLLITGDHTEPHHAHAITALHAVLPSSEITTLAGQGHTALVLAPDLVSTSMLDYLNRH
jgi:pimeloyl-ACP methyl ester carboxylesterase